MKAERQVWFQPTSLPPQLVYRQLFPAQVSVCAPGRALASTKLVQNSESCGRKAAAAKPVPVTGGKEQAGRATGVRGARQTCPLRRAAWTSASSPGRRGPGEAEMGPPRSLAPGWPPLSEATRRGCLRAPGWTAAATQLPPRLPGLPSTWAPRGPGAGPGLSAEQVLLAAGWGRP